MSTIQFTQEQMQSLFFPLLKEKGQLYQKTKNVFARKGIKGEKIISITSKGVETENTVREVDSFVVKNQTTAKEEYIVLSADFHQRYTFLQPSQNGFDEYQSKGKVMALKLTRKLWVNLKLPDKAFYYEPTWKEKAIAMLYDYVVCPPDYSEIYRIGRKEFWETYKKI